MDCKFCTLALQVKAPVDGGLGVGSVSGSLSLRGVKGVSLYGDHVNISSSQHLELRAHSVRIHYSLERDPELTGEIVYLNSYLTSCQCCSFGLQITGLAFLKTVILHVTI